MAKIDKIFFDIAFADPFYGEFLLNVNRVNSAVNLNGKPIGIWIEGMKIHMAIDEKQFKEMTDEEAIIHIKHVLFHLFLRHISRSQMFDKKLFHMAADVVVNQQTKNKNKLTYENLKLDPNLTAEEYYEKLEEMGEEGEGNETTDSDYGWGNASEEEIDYVIQETIQRAMEKGDVPYELQSLIQNWLKTDPIPWYMVIRYFGFSLFKVRSQPTWKRRNRRIKGNPGAKKDPFIKLAVAIDTSGSMSDEEIALCFKQIEYLNNMCKLECWIIECDAKVHKTYKYTGIPPEVTGRGGTAFQPAIDWATEKRVNGMIYLTDGYGDNPKSPPFPVLWVVTYNGNKECADFGKKIELPQRK